MKSKLLPDDFGFFVKAVCFYTVLNDRYLDCKCVLIGV